MLWLLVALLAGTVFANGRNDAAASGVTVEVETLGGGADYGGAMKAKAQAGEMPDICQIEGMGGYNLWKDYIASLEGQPWVKDTDLGFKVDGTVYGFPVAGGMW